MDTPMEALDLQREFEEQRRVGIGATDTPKILGLSKYGTALTVYDQKVNGVAEERHSLPAWLGQQLQGTVAQLYRSATGNVPRADNKHHVHAEYPFLVCHLDYRVRGQAQTLVECKTRAYMRGWGEDGSVSIPAEVWTQVQHEMMVTGALMCHVAVLFGHHTFRVYPIPRDDDFISHLIPKLASFWNENVLAHLPPDPSSHPLDRSLLARTHPSDDGALLSATPEQARLVRDLVTAEASLKVAEAEVEEVKNKIKAALGEHLGWETPLGTVTWKKTADVRRVDWQQVAIEVGRLLQPNDIDLMKMLYEISQRHTNISAGSRRFVFKEAEQE